jgi:hypothetical protein
MRRAMNATLWFTEPMMRGEAVWRAQRLLSERAGAALRADGLFGVATRDALRDFQRRRGLAEDGVLGPASWAALTGGHAAPDALLDGARIAALQAPHRHHPDGASWRIGRDGIEVDGAICEPSAAEGAMAAAVFGTYGEVIATVAARFPVPVELAVATICTESGGDPRARRHEPGCDPVDPARTPRRISVGLMQTLLSTAREALGDDAITPDALTNPSLSIRAGMAYIRRQAAVTRFDPPLVACAYNAGSLRFQGSPGNRWRLVQYPVGTGHHADRFCRFFNAALRAVATKPVPVPSFAALLR